MFDSHCLEGIHVTGGQTTEILVGKISIPSLKQPVKVCPPNKNYCIAYAGVLSPKHPSLEVPAGRYDLHLDFKGKFVDQPITVEAGETVVLEE